MKFPRSVLTLFVGWNILLASAGSAATKVTLPVEVVGEAGTFSSVTVEVPSGSAHEVRSLWMQIHNLIYDGMVSVQVNDSAWYSLSNATVVVAEPGKSYGGIGGGFVTLKVTLPLPGDVVVDGDNTLRFRFNHTDGLASGFRVLAFNLLTLDSRKVLRSDAFTQEDPNTWKPPLVNVDSIQTGRELWHNQPLLANALPNAPRIRAHCADCHAYDGRDLKYFGFSNASISARSRFHGLSPAQGEQVASYIRSLPVPTVGRPWNPPYQPGPGMDVQPIANWSAGAGLSAVLDSDNATVPYLFPAPDNAAALLNVFRPDSNLNAREIPISLQLPDWNGWLPRIHPLDAWGPAFEKSPFNDLYDGSKQSLRSILSAADLSAVISSARIVNYFDKWTNARRAFLKPYVERGDVHWTPDLATKAYSTQLWQLAKAWEITQEFALEGRGRELFGDAGESRTWFNAIPAATAPAVVHIPDGASGMGGSALTNEYFNAAWYELQILLNSGNHQHRNRLPVDWIYVISSFQDLYRQSHVREPGRLLVAVIKALQSTDPRIGPQDVEQGWRPSQIVDPTIMVSETWMPLFQPLSPEFRRNITEAFLAAWMEKTSQYPVQQYFRVGLTESRYITPESYGNVYGGRVWEAAPLFLSAGVNPVLINQLQKWGVIYSQMAARFQYAPKTTPPRKTTAPGKSGGFH